MNRPDEAPPASPPTDHPSGTGEQVAVDDPRVIAAVEEYLDAIESGSRPDRRQFLTRYPREVAAALAECLDGLEMVQSAGAELQPRPVGVRLKVLGDFRIIREVGRGGMGIVYEAEQLSLRRRVALKVLSAAGGLDERQLQRFRTEAQAAGSLHHAHIAPVFAVGCEHGVHYYAMQFIEGPSLASVIAVRRGRAGLSPGLPVEHYGLSSLPDSCCDKTTDSTTVYRPLGGLDEAVGGPPSSNGSQSVSSLPQGQEYWQTAARLGVEAAEALDHAHQHGIVHRDVKPANLLIDGKGSLWVVDFGLARLPTDAGLTMSGDLVGTLRYMSPEQVLARRGTVDHRTDVYSLGATLYELLTLTPAFPGNDRQDVLRRIANDEPPAPRRLNRAIPVDLETIVLKALAKDPAERYATAQELADDLRRFREDRPILARRPSLAQRGRRLARRHRSLVVCMSATSLVLMAGVIAGAVFFGFQQKDAREKVEASLGREQAALYNKLLQHASTVQEAHRPGYRAMVWEDLHKALGLKVPGKDPEAVAPLVLACLGDPVGLPPIMDLDAPRAFPKPAPIEKAGVRRIKAPAANLWAEYQNDVVWPPFADENARRGPTQTSLGNISQLRWSGDGSLLAAACEQGFVVWDVNGIGLDAGMAVRTRVGVGNVFSLALHPSGRLLATAGRQVEVWSLTSNRLVTQMEMPDPPPEEVEFSADGKLLLGFVGGKAKYGWPVSDTPEKRRLDAHRRGAPAVAFSPDGRLLASVCEDHSSDHKGVVRDSEQEVKLWDAATGQLLHTCRRHKAPIESVAFSPCGRLVVTGDLDGVINVWDVLTGQFLAQLPGSGTSLGEVWRLQFDAGMMLLAAAGRKAVAVWALRVRNNALTFEPTVSLPTEGVYDLAVRPDGSALAFLAQPDPDQPARLSSYDLVRRDAPKPLDVAVQHRYRALNFDPSGKLLTYATPDGRLGRWDWEKGAALPAVGDAKQVYQATLSADGRRVATAGPDRSVAVYELATGKRVLALPPEESDVWGLAWSPDGRRVAASLSDGAVALWDLEEVRARLAEFGIVMPQLATDEHR